VFLCAPCVVTQSFAQHPQGLCPPGSWVPTGSKGCGLGLSRMPLSQRFVSRVVGIVGGDRCFPSQVASCRSAGLVSPRQTVAIRDLYSFPA